ncbi:Fc receptor-like protein 6 [Carcharodon carcharias]|uniref:Fc receptor-like protein 6 n=1 Tax=Carcharodon carcharias TaxID=13397 RepID=UPI001B7DDBC4|nr:Fc receptor-like protein 6 [Carcharodon carcharias]
MWILILLICSLPVSGALWAKDRVTGVVGRAITIECHYDAQWYKSHMKYWCLGKSRQCNVVASTNWRNGRISVTDNKSQGIFIVTMEDLRSRDTGWYSCGIEKSGLLDQMFAVWLQISYEPMSVPVLYFSSSANISCSGGSVSVSCESVQGSLPIQYTWYEKTLSEDSKISDTNKLDLHCQSFKQQHHQYYCTASNNQGEKSSEMVNVSKINITRKNCSYVIQIGNIGPEYCSEFSTIASPTTHLTSTDIISTTVRTTPSDPENPERHSRNQILRA